MSKYIVFCMAVTAASSAHAAGQDGSDGPSQHIATGTPSNATATVSPATVAEAVTRPDVTAGDEPPFALSLGTSFASGDFGSGQHSRMVSTALGARYAIGTFRVSASIPYLNIRSRGVIFSGIDSTPVVAAGSRPGAPRLTSDGIGDLTLGAAYTLPESEAAPEIEFSGRIKLPTARDSDHLSSGKTDYSAGVQVTKTFGRVAPFVSATYRVFGDPAIVNLKNGFAASAGLSSAIGERTVALLSYHYAQAASRLIHDSHELFAGISTGLPHSKLRLTGFVTAGISSGAAAESGGLSLSVSF